MYTNRQDASERLSEELQQFRGEDGIILGIPRGGVPLANNIAKSLNFDLDIAMIKKIGHPLNPELAIGAVSLKDRIVNPADVDQAYIDKETERLREKLRNNYKKFTGREEPDYDMVGKTVIIVDDGIATGNTMMATVQLIKKEDPKQIIIAVPVAPPRTVKRFEGIVDLVVCPLQPKEFMAVGQFYEKFEQTDDSEVVELLAKFDNVEQN
ncbi:MAG: phosphoribosyltransferase [Candidatus Cyclobacteriaceae bacterium M2_1C_046]